MKQTQVNDTNPSRINVVKPEEEDKMFSTMSKEITKSRWMILSACLMHIYGEKMKVEDIGIIRMKLHNNAVQNFSYCEVCSFYTGGCCQYYLLG